MQSLSREIEKSKSRTTTGKLAASRSSISVTLAASVESRKSSGNGSATSKISRAVFGSGLCCSVARGWTAARP